MSILSTQTEDEESADADAETSPISQDSGTEDASRRSSYRRFCKALMLGIAYSANIGGTGTLIGTGPNIVLSGYFDANFPNAPALGFGSWFIFAFPCGLTALLFAWAYLSLLFCDDCVSRCRQTCCRKKLYHLDNRRVKEVIREHYKRLGPIKYSELSLILAIVVLVLCWLLRAPQVFPGWSDLFTDEQHPRGYLTDASVAIFFAFLLFVLPGSLPWKQSGESGTYDRLLDWETVQTKLPWGVVLLLGSGFAIAHVAQVSGLTQCIAVKLEGAGSLHPFLLSTWLMIVTTFTTEIISNVSVITFLLPILHSLSLSFHVNPLYFMVPCTIATSYAFMFPVATPPNAIVYAYGHLKISDMLLAGLGMNIMCMLILTLFTNTLGLPIFSLLTFPSYFNVSTANLSNSSRVC